MSTSTSESKAPALFTGKLGWGRITSIGLLITGTPTFDEWGMVGRQMLRLERTLPFVMGDWLNYGEAKFGQKYSQALEETDLSYSRLTTYAYVCGAVDYRRRHPRLTFSHHELVAPYEPKEQDRWLERAAANGWSVRELDDVIHQRPPRDSGAAWWLSRYVDFTTKMIREIGADRLRDLGLYDRLTNLRRETEAILEQIQSAARPKS